MQYYNKELTKAQRNALFAFAKTNSIRVEDYGFSGGVFIDMSSPRMQDCSRSACVLSAKKLSLEELIEIIAGNNKVVQLNSEHTATREGGEIVVGCQRFPVAKLTEAYEKLVRDWK